MKKILSFIILFSTTLANAEFNNNAQKYITPIKLDTVEVKKILDQASEKDPYILNMFSLNGTETKTSHVTFIPEKRIIEDTDIVLNESYNYTLRSGYQTTYVFGTQLTNCGAAYSRMSDISFNKDGEIDSIVPSSIWNINPQKESTCRFKGAYKFDPKRFTALRMDTKQVDNLFSEANKAQMDVYSLKNTEKYKELVIRPRLDNFEKSTGRVNVYTYKLENLGNKAPTYSLSAETLKCPSKERLTTIIMFNKDGTFKKMMTAGPAALDYRHLEFCEKFKEFI